MRSLVRSPALDVGSQPELDPSLSEVDYWARHVGVPPLVLADCVPMGQVQNVGDALRVD
jgi:hypothetical protein